MLTWAIVTLFKRAGVTDDGCVLVLAAIAGDVVIVAIVAAAWAGWVVLP